MPVFNGRPKRPNLRVGTSPGTHVRALDTLLSWIEEDTRDRHRKAVVKAHRDELRRSYPFELGVTDSDIAQALEEEDGIPQDDSP